MTAFTAASVTDLVKVVALCIAIAIATNIPVIIAVVDEWGW